MKCEDSDLGFLKSIMTFLVIILPSSSTVRQAIQLMRTHKIKKHMPVTDSTRNHEGEIIGKVTLGYLAEIIRISLLRKLLEVIEN